MTVVLIGGAVNQASASVTPTTHPAPVATPTTSADQPASSQEPEWTGYGRVIAHNLAVRACPRLSCGVRGRLAYGTTVYITGQARGDWVTGPYGRTNCWDYLPALRGYASDAWIYTGGDTCA